MNHSQMAEHNMDSAPNKKSTHENHENHHEMMEKDFQKRFWVTLALTLPVLLLSPTIQNWLNIRNLSFTGDTYVLFFLASIIVWWGAWPFFTNAKTEITTRRFGMMTLVSLAVLSGYLYSLGATFFFEALDFYWEIATLTLFLLFGHWMEMKAVNKAGGALKELAKLIPPTANKIDGDSVTEVQTSALQLDDTLLIKPGEKIPIDAEVIDGKSSVNESMITGESKPVHKKSGDAVIGGTINVDGSLTVRVVKIGKDTALSQIIELVRQTQNSKPQSQKLADKAATVLTFVAIGVGLLTFIYWAGFSTQGTLFALTLTITVIVIACPHALGLAIPTVTTIATTLAAKNGILVRDMQGVETAKDLDYIVLDKTGTLTEGQFGVSDVLTTGDWSKKKMLSYAAAVEYHSEHTIAQGIVTHVAEQKITTTPADDFHAIAGKGAYATVDGKKIHIGSSSYMNDLSIDMTALSSQSTKMTKQGKTVIFVSDDNNLYGVIALSDIIKTESRAAVQRLQRDGIKVAMLTGDNADTAAYVAKELGLDTFYAEVLPKDKANKVKELQKGGNKVAMVGDGVNDAPALTQADVGIAIGAGTDVAQESAEIVLMNSNPMDIAKLITLSKKTMRKMKQNLVWATAYNVVAIPLAAGVLYSVGIVLKPEWGALVMAASSIIVVANALLLKREQL